jgi:hypothetical protein
MSSTGIQFLSRNFYSIRVLKSEISEPTLAAAGNKLGSVREK